MIALEHRPLIDDFRMLRGRVGVFGGSFDPVHVAHLEAARLAIQAHRLDAVVFIPARQNPLKANSPRAGDEDRLKMLVLALSNERKMFVSAVEYSREGVSYTVDTLKGIKSQIGSASSLFLIVGADCLPQFDRWKNYEEVLALSTLIPVGRPESEGQPVALEQSAPAGVRAALSNMVQMNMDVSSRAIRAAFQRGDAVVREVPQPVAEYIAARGLYR